MKTTTTVNEYIKNLPPDQYVEMERVRKAVKQASPEAEEVISYGIPAFKYHGRILIYFAAHTHHMSIYPASDAMVEVSGGKLAEFRTSKGTLRFTKEAPIPESLLKQIVKFRQEQINSKLKV